MPDGRAGDTAGRGPDAFATRVVHAGAEPDELTGAVSPPIYQTSTYAQDGVGRPRGGYEYARTQNPTRERLERAVADLEGAAFGIAFASGSAATATLAELAAPGETLLVGDDVYGGTYRFFERVARPRGVLATYLDLAAGDAVNLAGDGAERLGSGLAAELAALSTSGRDWSGSRRPRTRS